MVGPKESVIIRRPVVAQDSYAVAVKTFEDVCTLKAVIAPVGSSEAVHMDRPAMTFTHRMFLDYSAYKPYKEYIRPSCRVRRGSGEVHGTTDYEIIGIEDHFKRAVTILLNVVI